VALAFKDDTARRVVVANSSSINNLVAQTIITWVFFLADASLGERFSQKNSQLFIAGGGSARVDWRVNRATTQARALTESSYVIVDEWNFIGVTYDETDGPRIFRGDLTAPVTEAPSYRLGGPEVGAGDTQSDSLDLFIGNSPVFTQSCSGHLALYMLFAERLELAQLEQQRIRPHITPSLKVWHIYDTGGFTRPRDLSGNHNHGTIVGAPATPHQLLEPRLDRSQPLVLPFVKSGAVAETITVDKWHPGIQQPYPHTKQVIPYQKS